MGPSSEKQFFRNLRQPAQGCTASLISHKLSTVYSTECSGADCITRFLEEGYDSLRSHQFESGMELSIGEWQKITLARAFLSPTPILVLD